MRCETARTLLGAGQEPPPDQLDALFEHLDICYSCQEFAALDSPKPQPCVDLKAAVSADVLENFNDRLFDRIQQHASVCEPTLEKLEVYELVVAPDSEPNSEQCAALFAHIDSCKPCSQALSDSEKIDIRGLLAAERENLQWDSFNSQLDSRLEAQSVFLELLQSPTSQSNQAIEPSEAVLAEMWQWLDSQDDVADLESSVPAALQQLSLQKDNFQLPDHFTDNVMTAIEFNGMSQESGWWRFAGPFLATAAALLLILNVSDFDFREGDTGIVPGINRVTPRVTPVSNEFFGINPSVRVGSQRAEWATFNGSPRAINRRVTPNRQPRRVEFSLPQGIPVVRPKAKTVIINKTKKATQKNAVKSQRKNQKPVKARRSRSAWSM